MDSEDLIKLIKTKEFRYTLLILGIVIVVMSATQSLWMNTGISIIYTEHQVSDVKNMMGQTYIVKGMFNSENNLLYDLFDDSNVAYVIVSNATDCQLKNGIMKLLVVNEESFKNTQGTFRRLEFNLTSKETKEDIPRIVLLKVLQGCDN